MKKSLSLLLIFCLLLPLVSCKTPKEIPVYRAYNEKKNVYIDVGMTKAEVDAMLGESVEFSGLPCGYIYFNGDEKNQVIVRYIYPEGIYDEYPEVNSDFVVLAIRIDKKNWIVHDPTCRIGGKGSDLSSKFHDTKSSPTIYYDSYYDKQGQWVENPFDEYPPYYISATAEDDIIHLIMVGRPIFR